VVVIVAVALAHMFQQLGDVSRAQTRQLGRPYFRWI